MSIPRPQRTGRSSAPTWTCSPRRPSSPPCPCPCRGTRAPTDRPNPWHPRRPGSYFSEQPPRGAAAISMRALSGSRCRSSCRPRPRPRESRVRGAPPPTGRVRAQALIHPSTFRFLPLSTPPAWTRPRGASRRTSPCRCRRRAHPGPRGRAPPGGSRRRRPG